MVMLGLVFGFRFFQTFCLTSASVKDIDLLGIHRRAIVSGLCLYYTWHSNFDRTAGSFFEHLDVLMNVIFKILPMSLLMHM
jgi:hypothetical protein